jgi:uncharacterized Tic20 family protein
MGDVSKAANSPSQDETIMAAIGHVTIIWPVLGIIAPVVLWATQREKSRFVAFQALQAAVYHITLILVGLVCGVCFFCYYVAMIVCGIAMPLLLAIPGAVASGEELPPEAVIAALLGILGMIVFYLAIWGLILLGLGVWAAYIGYGLYAAVANLRGKDFRYVIIGPGLERYLHQPSRESAGTGHASL